MTRALHLCAFDNINTSSRDVRKLGTHADAKRRKIHRQWK